MSAQRKRLVSKCHVSVGIVFTRLSNRQRFSEEYTDRVGKTVKYLQTVSQYLFFFTNSGVCWSRKKLFFVFSTNVRKSARFEYTFSFALYLYTIAESILRVGMLSNAHSSPRQREGVVLAHSRRNKLFVEFLTILFFNVNYFLLADLLARPPRFRRNIRAL